MKREGRIQRLLERAQRRQEAARIECPSCRAMVLRHLDEQVAAEAAKGGAA